MTLSKFFKLAILASIFFILYNPNSSYSIDKGDSLATIAKDINQPINIRLFAYKELVFHFETSDPEKALQYGNEGLSLPVVDSLSELLAKVYENMAFVHISAQDYEKAIPYLVSAAEAFGDAGIINKAAGTYRNIGVLNRKLGNYTEAIKYQMLSLEKYEQIEDSVEQVAVLMNIGNIYTFQKQAELGFPYFQQAYDIALVLKDSLILAESLNSLAFGYDHMSKKDTALHYYLLAIEGYEMLNRQIKKAMAEHDVALIYMSKNEYDNAEKMLLSCFEVLDQFPATMDIEKATIKSSLGRVNAKKDLHKLAIQYYQEALDVFRAKGVKTEEKSTLEFLSLSLAAQEEFEDAYNFHVDYSVMKDSIQNTEILAEIAGLTERYESEKKEKEILKLQHESEREARFRWFFISISGGILSAFIFLFLLYYHKKSKETQQIKNRLTQNVRELDILRQKIANETTQYTLPQEFTLNREEVNSLLKEALSDRELDVFMLLVEGHTNRVISEKLFVSVNTIKYHLQNIYVKLDVDNRADAIFSVSSSITSKSEMDYSTI